MRAGIIGLGLALAACVNAAGAPDRPAPFTSPAPAATQATDYPVAIDLPGGAYRLDPRHASVIFRIRHDDLAWFTARFDVKDATLELDPADPSRSRLAASVDVASVNTGVPDPRGERSFDRAIGRVLGGEAHPRISFVSTGIQRTGEHTARVTGDVTMNGQTHPATLETTFDGAVTDPLRGGAMVLGFSAHGVINRADWGVTEWQAFTGDDVQIIIEAELVKQ
jgi:polyisoprenoid-binding protein YceI